MVSEVSAAACTPALDVYGHAMGCLPHTGWPVLPVAVIGALLVVLGIALWLLGGEDR